MTRMPNSAAFLSFDPAPGPATIRSVFALTDPAGDTAARCRAAGIETDAPLDDSLAIAKRLAQFVTGTLAPSIAPAAAIAQASRRARAQQLAEALDAL